MKDILYCSVLRLGIMRSEVAVVVVEGVTRGGWRKDGERMTRRNGVSKEGARGASDKPHNAQDAFLDLCMRQSRCGCALVCDALCAHCVPRLLRARSGRKEQRQQQQQQRQQRATRDRKTYLETAEKERDLSFLSSVPVSLRKNTVPASITSFYRHTRG